ncbi:MAG: nitroreductase [Rhodospirillaceae bacterium]|nr:nitroreductase [Rhodospirillaceae bacterium]
MPDTYIQSPPDFGYGRRDPAAGLNDVEAAITTRRSIRAFLRDKPVPRGLIERILNVSARAPSGTNIQPWHVVAVAGDVRDEVCAAIHEKRDGGGGQEMGYNYYPVEWFEPYVSRRRKLGWDMYGLLDIKKGEREKTYKQHGRNFDFFDAPVGLFFHMDGRMERGSFLDIGLFIENVMVAARSHGLDTCPQAAWVDYSETIKSCLGIPENHIVLCGMCLGYEDTSAPVNALYSEREPASFFTDWQGFDSG